MRLLLITPEFGTDTGGGLGVAVHELALALLERGWEIAVAVPRLPNSPASMGSADAADNDAFAPGLEIFPLPFSPQPVVSHAAVPEADRSAGEIAFKTSPAYVPGIEATSGEAFGAASAARHAAVGIGTVLQSRRFDVIWAHDWFAVPAALRARTLYGAPIALHFHSLETCRNFQRPVQPIREWEARGAREADVLTAVSHALAARISREFGVPVGRIRVVHNAVSDAFCTGPAEFDAARTGSPDAPYVWFLGRFAPQKGPDIFLRAAAHVLRAIPEARFVMAGDGPLREVLHRRVAKLGLSGAVEFPGWIPHDRLPSELSRAAVVALPSVCEPFGLAAIEAAACGASVVVTEKAGAVEVLPDIRTVPPFAADILAREIVDLIRNREKRRDYASRLQRAARARRWTTAAAEADAILRAAVETGPTVPDTVSRDSDENGRAGNGHASDAGTP